MDLIEHRCIRCGGELQKLESRWKCPYCGSKYDDKSTQKHTQTLKELFDETKLEIVNNQRRLLYDAIHAEHISSDEVKSACQEIKKYLPDDFQANFFYKACTQSDKEIKKLISQIDIVENYEVMESVVGFLIRSLSTEFILSVRLLIEKTYKENDLALFEKYSTLAETEAEKVQSGIYETKLPRKAFIAYSSKDVDKVLDLVDFLEAQGISCFIAVRNLRHGRGAAENYEKALQEAMDNCKVFVFVSTLSSRSIGCDALKVEIPYIHKHDIENAPSEYKNDYDSIPTEYKKPRVQFMIEKTKGFNAGDEIVNEFFNGFEWAYSKEEVAQRILRLLAHTPKKQPAPKSVPTSAPVTPPPTQPKTTAGTGAKYCKACGYELVGNPENCPLCGTRSWVDGKDVNVPYTPTPQSKPQPKPQPTPPTRPQPPKPKKKKNGKVAKTIIGWAVALCIIAALGYFVIWPNIIYPNLPDTELYTPEILQSYYYDDYGDLDVLTITGCTEDGQITAVWEFVNDGRYGKANMTGKIVEKKNNGDLTIEWTSQTVEIMPSGITWSDEYEARISNKYSVLAADRYNMIPCTRDNVLKPEIKTPVLTLDGNTLNIDYDSNITQQFIVEINGEERNFDPIESITLGDDYEPGEYTVRVKAVNTDKYYAESLYSDAITVTVVKSEIKAPVLSIDNGSLLIDYDHDRTHKLIVEINGEEIVTDPIESITLDDRYEPGTYTVRVKATNEQWFHSESEYSDAVILKKLDKVTFVGLNNSILTFAHGTPDEGETFEYDIYVDNELYTTLTETSMDLREIGRVGKHTVNVVVRSSKAGSVSSELSDQFEYTALNYNVQLSSDADVFTWSAIEGATGYEIYVNGNLHGTYTADNRSIRVLDVYDESGKITVAIKVLGNGTTLLDSPMSESVEFTFQQMYVMIKTPEDLLKMNGSAENFLLTSDIDLSGVANWTPINDFKGLLVGNGHAIKNLTINASTSNVGLFSTLSGRVENLTLENVNVTVTGSNENVGALAGTVTGLISNVTVSGSVTATESTNVGGVAGKYDKAANYTLSALTNSATISGKDYVGGIFGYQYGGNIVMSSLTNSGAISASGNHAGGLAGHITSSRFNYNDHTLDISNSSNTGNVTGKQYVGGLFGEAYSSANSSTISSSSCTAKIEGDAYVGCISGKVSNITVNTCTNTGSTLIANKYVTEDSNKYAYVGGFVGYGYIFNNCQNDVEISYTAGGSYVGGIAGYATFTVTATTENLSNTASISGADYVGGIFGYLYSGNMTASSFTNSGAINGSGIYVGGLAGYYTAARFDYTDHTLDLTDCSNTGDIKGKQYVGGMFGSAYSSNNKAKITSSSCKAKIEGEAYVGCIAGKVNNITVDNCVNTGSTLVASKYITEDSQKLAYVGGIAGYGYIFTNCTNDVEINYTAGGLYVGGIAGYAYCTAATTTENLSNTANISGADYVGGIFGYKYGCDTSILSYSNSGNITGSGNYVGGLAGYLTAAYFDYHDHTLNLLDSTNTGNISGKQFVGGLFGEVYASSNTSTISSSSCAATISGEAYVGCIAGKISRITVDSCKNTGSSINASGYILENDIKNAYVGGFAGCGYVFSNCTNEVNINYTSAGQYVGGIAGYIKFTDTVSMTELANNADISGAAYVGGLFGYQYSGNIQQSSLSNTGNITGSGNYVGGLIGYASSARFDYHDHSITVSDSSNTGNISGNHYVGGLFGELYSSKDTSSIIDSSSTGTIAGTEFYADIAGKISNVTIK